jgi:protein-tyrosine-phosphatase
MTKIIMLIIIVAAALCAYNYFTTGEISLLPPTPLSEEEQEVKSLADSFSKARKMVRQAQRSAAVGGIGNIDTVADEMNEIDQVESDLIILMDSLETDSAMDKAEQLEREIEEFKRGR